MNIAIDGPAGAGKSTAARRVAAAFGFRLLDTGAMYRSVALAALRQGVDVDDVAGLVSIARALSFAVDAEGRLEVGGVLPGASIRTPEVSAFTSRISVHEALRDVLVEVQRALVEAGGFVLEGRDTGSVVCPGAELKVFLTASLEARARRRLGDYGAPESEVNAVAREIEERDRRDSERAVAPLHPAPDAVVLDTSDLTLDEVVERVVALAKEQGAHQK